MVEIIRDKNNNVLAIVATRSELFKLTAPIGTLMFAVDDDATEEDVEKVKRLAYSSLNESKVHP